jgi:Carboxypeptidase regulatory-like domain
MMKFALRVLSCTIVVMLLWFATKESICLAQSDTGRLQGTVTDAQGAAVPGASVTVTNSGTGRATTVTTDDSGLYTVSALPPGKYHVEIKKENFNAATADFTLEVSQVQEINLKLQPGSVTTSVTVSGEVPLVDTATSSTGEVIQGRQITELPLNGRNFTQLALLTPGVTRGAYGDIASGGTSGTAAESFRNSDTGGAALSANGLRPQADNFILDGVDNNEGLVNSIIFFPPAEAIEEFRVNTSVAPAEFGRGGGAIVQTSIKSGTNDIHGSAFLFRRSGFGEAHPYGTSGPITFRLGQFGGTVGAPIWKNKLFIFGDYQGRRQDEPVGIEHASVPTDKMRTGDFSELLGTTLPSIPAATTCPGLWTTGSNPTPLPQFAGKGYIYDPTTCLPFGWNGTVGTNIISNPNPVGLKYLQGYPEPTITTAGVILNNFTADRQSLRNYDDFDIRVDFNATQNDQIFFRYSYGEDNFTVTNRLGPNNPSGFGSGNNINHPRGATVGYTRVFSSGLLNEFHFGYVSTTYGYNPPNIGQRLAANLGIPGANPVPLLGGQALIGGNNTELEYQGDGGPYNVPQKLYQFNDSLSHIHSRHVFKYGANIGKREVDFVQGNSAKGYFILGGVNYPGTGRFTGYEVSEVLAGFVDYTIGQFLGLYQTRSWETGYFAQDDWRVSNRLTLNLGVRYDLYTWPYEVNNRQSNFDPVGDRLVLPGTAGWPRSLINTDKTNFAPRVGFAYDLNGNGKTVIRGGYGLFYFLDRGGVGNQLSNNPNFNGTSTFQACPTTCADPAGYRVTLSGQGPLGNNNWLLATNALPTSTNNVNINNLNNVNVIYYPENSKNSDVHQWNVGVERQLDAATVLKVAYVGTHMDHLATAFNANAVPLGGGPKHWANLGAVNEYAYIGSGHYNGLQTQVERRLSKGLQFTAAYTFSHAVDNSNGAFSATGGGGRIFVDANGNPLLNFNNGNSDQDIRHYFVFASMYELPFGKGKQYGANIPTPLDYIIGGWQWNNIITLESGTPIDLSVGGTNDNPGNRPDVSGPVSAKIVNGQGVITGNFALPPLTGSSFTRPGDLARNALYGPGLHTWDTGVMKDFKLTERFKAEFRVDAFNLFNHPQFQNGSFNTAINFGGGATTATGTMSGAQARQFFERQMQFAFRLTF